ncbi:MAG: hypothetical protein WC370_00390 [Dehalococcoidales bacterium]
MKTGMKPGKKALFLPLLLVQVLLMLPAFGCTTDTTNETTIAAPTTTPADMGQQIQQILVDAVEKQETLTSYKYSLVMDMDVEATGGTEQGKVTMNYQYSGAIDLPSEQLQMSLAVNMKTEIPGEAENYNMETVMDVYMLDDWVYARMEITGEPEQWVRAPVTDEIETSFKLNPVDQQMGLLDSPSDIEYVGDASINGIDCYVVAIKPSIEALEEWFTEQNTDSEIVDMSNMMDFADTIRSFSYTCYISKESVQLEKVVFNILFAFTPEQTGDDTDAYDELTMYINMDIEMFDQNIPFAIDLPDEAANAQDTFSDPGFLE